MVHRFFRLLGCLGLTAALACAAPSPELSRALADFRAAPPAGWAFTQVTVSEDKNLTERYDPSRPPEERWTLLEKDGRRPTEADLATYREQPGKRGGELVAPDLTAQLDADTAELVSDDGDRAVWRFRLRPGNDEDFVAAHMTATYTLHRPTGSIERVELANFEPFDPSFFVKVNEARTVMEFTLPEGDRPARPRQISMRVRGRSFWFKSLDSELSVTYRDYEAKPAAVP